MMLTVCEMIVKTDDMNIKGIYRKAFAEKQLEKFTEALETLTPILNTKEKGLK